MIFFKFIDSFLLKRLLMLISCDIDLKNVLKYCLLIMWFSSSSDVIFFIVVDLKCFLFRHSVKYHCSLTSISFFSTIIHFFFFYSTQTFLAQSFVKLYQMNDDICIQILKFNKFNILIKHYKRRNIIYFIQNNNIFRQVDSKTQKMMF